MSPAPRCDPTEPASTSAPKRQAEPEPKPTPPAKRQRLPSLPSTFDSASLAHNNPAAHQGRLRARPFVDGDYYAHVYVELEVPSALGRVIDQIVSEARKTGERVHSLLDEPAPSTSSSAATSASSSPQPQPQPGPSSPTPPPPPLRPPVSAARRWRPLHVSLSHPLPLRRDARDTFRTAVARALASSGAFKLSLAGEPVVYYNAPRSACSDRADKPGDASRQAGRGRPTAGARAFLGLRVGAGARELGVLLGKLEGVLKRLHLPLYHEEAEFHASFAWALCGRREASGAKEVKGARRAKGAKEGKGEVEEEGEGENEGQSVGGRGEGGGGENRRDGEEPDDDEASTPFPPALIHALATHTDTLLGAQPVGGWRISHLCIKIAKDVVRIPL